jgi:hypothetical protein
MTSSAAGVERRIRKQLHVCLWQTTAERLQQSRSGLSLMNHHSSCPPLLRCPITF